MYAFSGKELTGTKANFNKQHKRGALVLVTSVFSVFMLFKYVLSSDAICCQDDQKVQPFNTVKMVIPRNGLKIVLLGEAVEMALWLEETREKKFTIYQQHLGHCIRDWTK